MKARPLAGAPTLSDNGVFERHGTPVSKICRKRVTNIAEKIVRTILTSDAGCRVAAGGAKSGCCAGCGAFLHHIRSLKHMRMRDWDPVESIVR